ncbi:MAG: sigma-54-dependent Fis family transcriptional regulator [Candidatus Hydrogenedentes bacterium]|nr:sigma-54-dependent Fis family transcriptional regulator [Candidatus Hydrogenedentota bacterium]
MQTWKQTSAVWPVGATMPELGLSTPMLRVYELAGDIARSEGPILLLGEPGTGKRRLAQWIHDQRRGATAPFVQVSWDELSELFVERRLFGFPDTPNGERADRSTGQVESAAGGTLYLQEIGRFSLATQAKLARVISDHCFEIPGANQSVTVDTRVILSSSLGADALLERGALHRDLFELVSACSIELLPLRERKEDILPLAFLAMRKFAAQYHKDIRHIDSTACAVLISHAWPGNVSELEHVIERAVVACHSNSIDVSALPASLRSETGESIEPEEKNLDTTLDNIERALIIDALKAAKGNQAKAAHLLGITERMMGLRVRKHGLAPRGFRSSV